LGSVGSLEMQFLFIVLHIVSRPPEIRTHTHTYTLCSYVLFSFRYCEMPEFFHCLDLFARRQQKTSVKLATEPAAVWDLLMEYKVILIASYFWGLQSLYARINSFVKCAVFFIQSVQFIVSVNTVNVPRIKTASDKNLKKSQTLMYKLKCNTKKVLKFPSQTRWLWVKTLVRATVPLDTIK
jgi:hypothetical protein